MVNARGVTKDELSPEFDNVIASISPFRRRGIALASG